MIALGLAVAAHAGAWTRELGSAYVKAGWDGYTTTAYAAPSTVAPGAGAAQSLGVQSYFGYQASLYGEAGLSPAHPVQLSAAVPLAVGTTQFREENPLGAIEVYATVVRPGDLRVMPQLALSRKLPLAVAVETKVPLYRNDAVCADNNYALYCAHPGDGQIDVTGWAFAGAPLVHGRGFVEGGLGYRARTEWYLGFTTDAELADGVVGAATAGWNLGPVLAMWKADAVVDWKRDEVTPQGLRTGPALIATVFEGFALEARGSYDLWVRNTSRGVGFGGGVSWRR